MNSQRSHRVVLQVLQNDILPYVFQVQDAGVPYPAKLWKGETCESETGTVMFNIEDTRLTAEYFAYDGIPPFLWMSTGHGNDTPWKLVLDNTQVEIPVSWIRESLKAGLIDTAVNMPLVKVYECDIQGWLGNPKSEVRSATITITDIPNLHMPQSSFPLPEETIGDNLTAIRTDTRSSVLTLKAGAWEIDIMEVASNPGEEVGYLYTASLRKADRSPFTLSDDEGIIVALRQFLSFQAGGWINIPTIVCRPSNPSDWVITRAYVGRFTSRSTQRRSRFTATDFRDWPELFKEFWMRHMKNTRHLNNAIHHYVSCSEIFENSYGIDYATVAARSTLEAVIRWWNGLPENYEFTGDGEHGFYHNLVEAVEKAELGKDKGRQIDEAQMEKVIDRASKFRNRIDHGRAGNVGSGEMQKIIAHQQYMHHLARLLILAKLGLRNTDARGSFCSPQFND